MTPCSALAQWSSALRTDRKYRDLEVKGHAPRRYALALILSGEVIELGDVSCVVTYVHDVT